MKISKWNRLACTWLAMALLVNLCFIPVYGVEDAAAGLYAAVTDITTGRVEISLDSDEPEGTWITVLTTTPSNTSDMIAGGDLSPWVNYINEVQVDKDGDAFLSYYITTAASGTYSVYARAKTREWRTTFYYASPTDVESAMQTVNAAADAAALRRAIESNKSYLQINTAVYDKLNDVQREALCSAILQDRKALSDAVFGNPDQFREAFCKASLIAAGNDLDNPELLCELLEAYAPLFSIDSSAYATFMDLPNAGRLAVAADIQSHSSLDWSSLVNAFYDAVICESIAAAKNWTEILIIIENNGVVLDLDTTYYSRLKSPSTVIKKLVGVKVNTRAELKKIFEAEAEVAYKAENASGGSSGLSGLGSMRLSSAGSYAGTQASQELEQAEPIPLDFQFEDMDSAAWAVESVESLAQMGVLNGRDGHHFEPDAPITREEFVKVLMLAFEVELQDSNCDFEDVQEGAWYYPYIAAAASLGLINGTDEAVFGIGESITRQDIAVLIYRFAAIAEAVFQESEQEIAPDYSDVREIADYAVSAVLALTDAGIINGMENGAFMPYGLCTRAEAAKAVYETLRYVSLAPAADWEQNNAAFRSPQDSLTEMTEYQVLAALDIIPEEKGGVIAEYYYTAEMVNILRNLTGDENSILAQIQEFQEYGEKVGYISYGQALKTLVDILGYTVQANAAGGYPAGYLKTAQRIGFIRSVGSDLDMKITKADFIQLVYAAIETDIQSVYGYQDGDIVLHTVQDGETLLSTYHNIYKAEGVVTANEITGISSANGTGIDSGRVRIDDTDFYYGSTSAKELLGYTVTAFYHKVGGETGTLLACFANSINRVTSVLYRDIASCDGNQFVYYDQNGRQRSLLIPPEIDVIYNNVFLNRFDPALFCPIQGEVIFIDYDGNGMKDVVRILDVYDLVVNTVNVNGLKIYDRYDNQKSLDLDAMEAYTFRNESFENLRLDSIKSLDILSVAKSQNGEYAEIIKCEKSLTGIIESLAGDKAHATINGTEYEIAEMLPDKDKLKVGATMIYYLNRYDQIANFIQRYSESKSGYGYILNSTLQNKAFEKTVKFRMLTQDGLIEVFSTGDTVTIDGVKYNDMDEAYRALLNGNPAVPNQLVIYTIDGIDNTIKELDLAYAYKSSEQSIPGENMLGAYEDEDSLYKFYIGNAVSETYRSAQYNFMGKCVLDTDALVFFVPSDITGTVDETMVSVGGVSSLLNAVSYKADGYKIEADRLSASAVVIYDANPTTTITESNYLFVVSDTMQSWYNDEIYTTITGYMQNAANSFMVEDTALLPEGGLNPGDVVRISIDGEGIARQIERIFDVSAMTASFNNPFGAFSSATRFSYGAVMDKQEDVIYMEIGDGTILGAADSCEYLKLANANIYVVDLSEKKLEEHVRIGSISDVMDFQHFGSAYSKVLVRMSYGRLYDLIIYNE